MKVSEKTLELNVGAELLDFLRVRMNMPKAYLRGLTQREENRAGVDFFARLPRNTFIFAFQFKAPRGREDGEPYKFTLNRGQHTPLHQLAQLAPDAVFYVLPFYVLTDKLERDVPQLAQDTWLLPVAPMDVDDVFDDQWTKQIHCDRGFAQVNPKYDMMNLSDEKLSWGKGIGRDDFADWYQNLWRPKYTLDRPSGRMSPWLVRGLRIAIVGQEDRVVG